jgi:hypothetical protein
VVKLFDATFWSGTALVGGALAVTLAVLTAHELPWIGSGRGALIAVALLGITGCAIGGVSQAPALGWTHPIAIFGAITGVIALLFIAAGVFGWDPIVRPIASIAPGIAAVGGEGTVRLAIAALGGVIAVKWLVAVGLAAAARLT